MRAQFFAATILARSLSLVAAMSTSASRVRVVSYNLLSSKLARPSHFTRADPAHLEPEHRLPLILAKLEKAMDRGFAKDTSAPPTIFALQEVCYPFASKLHTFFANRGYHLVTGLYGRPFNGYMGIAIAYPTKHFETLDVDICRLSDERPGGWPRKPVVDEEGGGKGLGLRSIIQQFTRTLVQTVNDRIVKRLTSSGERVIDPWEMSENRFNVLLTATLRFREGGSFVISNYHMPCAFYAPPVMNIHSELAAKRVQYLASKNAETEKALPFIFAGDFNILPGSPHYNLLTTGELDASDPTYPPPKHGVEWKVESLPMDSAYAKMLGLEPEFSNYAHIRDQEDPFIGTLDYIFLSQNEWTVHEVQRLPRTKDSGGPFPNETEPSDHLLIAADLELLQETSESK
ncbi:hypothetical protein ACHAXT_010032 [Thalassiosira profunda]